MLDCGFEGALLGGRYVANLKTLGGSADKESASDAGDLGLIPGLGRFPWRRAWHSTLVFLPEESPWTEETGGLQSMEPDGLQSMGSQRVRHE